MVYSQWATDPITNIQLGFATETKFSLTMVGDGNGGAFVLWGDRRNFPDLGDVFGQYITSQGVVRWDENGHAVNTAIRRQNNTQAVADGMGNVFVMWLDERHSQGSLSQPRLYAQKLDAEGKLLWDETGVNIPRTNITSVMPLGATHLGANYAVPDGQGGFIVFWANPEAPASPATVFAQRVNGNGQMLWNNGDPITVHSRSQNQPNQIALEDGEGGAYVIYRASSVLRINRINSAGELLWGETGKALFNTTGPAVHYRVAKTTEGNILVSSKLGSQGRLQLVSAAGELLWNEGGILLNRPGDDFLNDISVAADETGMYASFVKGPVLSVQKLYVQKLSLEGDFLWGEDGLLVNGETGSSRQMTWVHPDGLGGAVVVYYQIQTQGVVPTLRAANIRPDGLLNEEIKLLTLTGKPTDNYQLMPDEDGNFIVSWIERRDGIQGTYVMASRFGFAPYSLDDGGENPTQISSQSNSSIRIYPNPVSDLLTIDFGNSREGLIRIFDTQGRMMLQKDIHEGRGNIDLTHIPVGLYFLQITGTVGSYSRKIIINR